MKPIVVDLGLSVNWADRNFGTTDDYPIGHGTTLRVPATGLSMKEKNEYFNNAISNGWSSQWRLPTFEETLELFEKCSFQNCICENINTHTKAYGYKITGPNGRYIFIPNDEIVIDGPRIAVFSDCRDSPYGIYNPKYLSKRQCVRQYNLPYIHLYTNIQARPVTQKGHSNVKYFLDYTLCSQVRFELKDKKRKYGIRKFYE